MKINILAEVEAIFNRSLTGAEWRRFKDCRSVGMANPYDIANVIKMDN